MEAFLLNEGRIICEGTAEEVLRKELLEEVFRVKIHTIINEDGVYIRMM